ncbi:hypothetical protein QI302_02160 [Staphylococcus saprophyticus]|nr:hypothetical protein [Staphylococcus saprophyticus]MDW4006747.1 hypothetical protein [Staphylococcus saprophyticus]MDW4219811.1 hypothetical protein [Staphylococcus saprophyticus]MDW4338221.1 hypothetical protein [Staphylococcus saprophyticus]
MQNNQNEQHKPNSDYMVNYLVDDNARLTKENAMLKAIIQEQNEKFKELSESQKVND